MQTAVVAWTGQGIDALTGLLARVGVGWDDIQSFAPPLGIVALLLLLIRQLERIRPIERHDNQESRAEIAMDFKHGLANYLITWLLTPVTAACSVAIVNATGGGGLITLAYDDWVSWTASFLICLVVFDVHKYWLHRISHSVPALWALHSFHHSAERVTVITGARHLWLHGVVTGGFFPVMAILFTMPPQMVTLVYAVNFFPDGLAHINYRFNLGRFVVLLNNPQWHRIHHSPKPEHIDKNFAAMLPLMDFIFGTAVVPAWDEFPSTGLTPSERPGVVEGLLWPFRHHLRALRSRSAVDDAGTSA